MTIPEMPTVERIEAMALDLDFRKGDVTCELAATMLHTIAVNLSAQDKASEVVGIASYMPATDGFTMACFKASDVPEGTKLYTDPLHYPKVTDEMSIKAIEVAEKRFTSTRISIPAMSAALEAALRGEL